MKMYADASKYMRRTQGKPPLPPGAEGDGKQRGGIEVEVQDDLESLAGDNADARPGRFWIMPMNMEWSWSHACFTSGLL